MAQPLRALVALRGRQFKSQQQARCLTTTVTPVPPADSSSLLCPLQSLIHGIHIYNKQREN